MIETERILIECPKVFGFYEITLFRLQCRIFEKIKNVFFHFFCCSVWTTNDEIRFERWYSLLTVFNQIIDWIHEKTSVHNWFYTYWYWIFVYFCFNSSWNSQFIFVDWITHNAFWSVLEHQNILWLKSTRPKALCCSSVDVVQHFLE